MSIPPEFKALTPFVKRAEELDKDKSSPESALVAYYCRTFAMDMGIKMSAKAGPEAQTYLLGLMTRLEQDKQKAVFTEEEGKMVCTEFASKIFSKADDEDRAGASNRGTARTFYAAAIFMEILEQFGELDEVDAQKIKYAKWKATDILKAIKEGRPATPGGFGEEAPVAAEAAAAEAVQAETSEANATMEGVDHARQAAEAAAAAKAAAAGGAGGQDAMDIPEAPLDIPSAPAVAPTPAPDAASPYTPPPSTQAPPPGVVPGAYPTPSAAPVAAPSAPPVRSSSAAEESRAAIAAMRVPGSAAPHPASAPAPATAASVSVAAGPARKGITREEFADASELAKFAVAALDAKEADLAVDRLRRALQILT